MSIQDKLVSTPKRIWDSTVGLKLAMAVSGAVLVAFVVGHMLGNLQVYAGQDVYNDYAAFMQGLGGLLWVARLSLLALLAIHVAAGIKLKARNTSARKLPYAGGLRTRSTNWNARVMVWTGIIVLAYLVYHIAHFTLEAVSYREGLVDAAGRRDLYTNFVLSFQNPINVAIYVVGNLAIASHLWHGVSSMFHTLGIAAGPYRRAFDYVGPTVAVIVGVGNISMPLACLFGLLEA